MRSTRLARLASVSAICALAIPLGACQTSGSETKSVTLESIKIVCLSRKDTRDTILQVVENNAALIELGAKKPDCKRRS